MLSQPATVVIPTAMARSTSPTKKRRRRAPATGAAEDCFTCRSHGIKCDRRRPYCGPCLDSNQDCKGYRTQLTWGVGVASRGKLRGMSLPVINAVTEQQRKDKIAKQRSDKAISTEDKAKKVRAASTGSASSAESLSRNPSPSSANKLSIITNYDFVNMEPPSSTASRNSSMLSTPQSGISGTTASPALSAVSSRSGLPSHRLSPQSGMSSPYSANSQQPPYHSPAASSLPSPAHHSHQHHQQPPSQQYQSPPPSSNGSYSKSEYHKSPYSHVSLPPQQQQQQAPSMMLSPMSEYESNYSGTHSSYPASSAPPSAPLYDIVPGVSTSYHPSPCITVTSSAVSYAPAPAPMHAIARPRVMENGHLHHPSQHPWNGSNVGTSSNLHHHHHPQHPVGPPGHNLSELLYDEDMLSQFQ